MRRKLIFAYLFAFIIMTQEVLSLSLIERLAEKMRHSKQDLRQDLAHGSDAIAGPKSIHAVGSFAGRPILPRQRNVFIDNQGVPVPVDSNEDHQAKRPLHIRRLFRSPE